MLLIPNACGPLVLPDDCLSGVFDIGQCLVEIGIAALQPFLPAEQDEGLCAPIFGFVAFGDRPQPDDICNQLTALLQRLTPNMGRNGAGCTVTWSMSWRIEAVFAVYPGIRQDEDLDAFAPSVEAQEMANQWLYAVGMALAGAYASEVATPTCAKLMTASSLSLGSVMPSGPRGMCAGWHFDVEATYAGGI